jgi:hypothetical protein
MRVLMKVVGNGDVTSETIRQGLLNLGRFEGPGGTFKFDTNGDVQKELRILTIKNGKFVPFEG